MVLIVRASWIVFWVRVNITSSPVSVIVFRTFTIVSLRVQSKGLLDISDMYQSSKFFAGASHQSDMMIQELMLRDARLNRLLETFILLDTIPPIELLSFPGRF